MVFLEENIEMALKDVQLSLKYKFLLLLVAITFSAIAIFFYITFKIFSEDKRLSIFDLNLTAIRATTSEMKFELRSRLEDLQAILPKIYSRSVNEENVFEGTTSPISAELLRIQFLNAEENEISVRQTYLNNSLLVKNNFDQDIFEKMDKTFPILKSSLEDSTLKFINRSTTVNQKGKLVEGTVLTLLLPATFLNAESKNLWIAVDLLQDFLRRKLKQSENTELFLISKEGKLISHPLLRKTVDFAASSFPHPVLSRLGKKVFPRESFEAEVEGESYLCNLAETGFSNLYLVSQIRKKDAFIALEILKQKTFMVSLIIFAIAGIFSVVFVTTITNNIRKLWMAAEEIGNGNFKVKLKIQSKDEIERVAKSFNWMVARIQDLMEETATKARMQEELETARIVQSTILSIPSISSEFLDIESYYLSASECGGDILDALIEHDKLTFFIGDATGHGAPAAIVTAVAKSCFSTLSTLYAGSPLSPDQIASILNQIIYSSCRGRLLMTMCIVQVDLSTGKTLICNAGHESPMWLRESEINRYLGNSDNKRKIPVEVMFARGERLGFDPKSEYVSEEFQLSEEDTILIYTDGVTESESTEGKEWGERNLKKVFGGTVKRGLSQIKKDIIDGIETHTGGFLQKDDITFMIFKWKKSLMKRNDKAA